MRKPSLQRVLPLWLTVLKLLKKAPKSLSLPQDLVNPNLLIICAGSLQTDSFRWPPDTVNSSAKKRNTRGRLALCATSDPEVMDSFKVYYHGLVSSPQRVLCGSEDGTEYNTASSTLFLESESEESPRGFFDCKEGAMSADEDAQLCPNAPSSTSNEGENACRLVSNKKHCDLKGREKLRLGDDPDHGRSYCGGKNTGKYRLMLRPKVDDIAELECKEVPASYDDGAMAGVLVEDMTEAACRGSPCELSANVAIHWCCDPTTGHRQALSRDCVDAVTEANHSFRNVYSTDAVISRHNPIINHIQVIQSSWNEAGDDDDTDEEEFMKYPDVSSHRKLSFRFADDYRSSFSSDRSLTEEDDGEITISYSNSRCRQSSADKVLLSRAISRDISAFSDRSIDRPINRHNYSHLSVFPSSDIIINRRSHGDLSASSAMAPLDHRHVLGSVGISPDVSLCRFSVPIFQRSEAMTKYSQDPCSDFITSITEMIVAHDLRDSEELEDLFQCYLHLNPPKHHPIITFAFLSTMVNLNIIPSTD